MLGLETFDNCLWEAALEGHDPTNIVTSKPRLIDAPNPYESCRTPMHAAALNGHVSVIETLVLLGSKAIDTPDKLGHTPMHAAADIGHVAAMEALVRLGSKAIDAPDNNGWTPLIFAASNGHVSVIKRFDC